jgi:hypothetical protein
MSQVKGFDSALVVLYVSDSRPAGLEPRLTLAVGLAKIHGEWRAIFDGQLDAR